MNDNQQDDKDQKLNEESVYELASMVKELEAEIEQLKEKQEEIKEEIRGLLKELGTNRLRNEQIEIKISYPKSFDTGLFGMEYPELYAKYTSIERTTKEKVVVNEKDLKRFYPDEYEKCAVDLTPRLTIQ